MDLNQSAFLIFLNILLTCYILDNYFTVIFTYVNDALKLLACRNFNQHMYVIHLKLTLTELHSCVHLTPGVNEIGNCIKI